MGSAAAATRAAIFGPAAPESFDQPAVSRIFTKESSLDASPAPAADSGASGGQAPVTGLPEAAAARKRSSSARQSWRPVRTSAPPQALPTAPAASGIVSSAEHNTTKRATT